MDSKNSYLCAFKKNSYFTMAHTFLYTIETPQSNIAVKFASPTKVTSEFLVTFLTAPHIEPFTMMFENEKWQFPEQMPAEVRALEEELLKAARKFQR
jgi:hypothetical protein